MTGAGRLFGEPGTFGASTELRRLRLSLSRRLVLLAVGAAVAVLLHQTEIVVIPPSVFIGFAGWGVLVVAGRAAMRGSSPSNLAFGAYRATQILDVIGALFIAHEVGATLLFAPAFLAMAVSLGSQTLPRRSAFALGGFAAVGYAIAVIAELQGAWPATGPFASESPVSAATRIAAIIIVTVLLLSVATIQRGFNRHIANIEERHARLLDATRDIIITVAADGTMVSVNHALETQLGWTRAEVLGKPFAEYAESDDQEIVLANLTFALDGATARFDVRLRAAKGSWRLFSTTIAPIIDRGGRATGAICIARDVTEQRAEARLLHNSERQLRLLVQSINETVFTADADLRFTAVYGHWTPGAPITPDDVVGKRPVEVFGRRLGGRMVEQMRHSLEGRTVEIEEVIRFAGENRHFRLWFTPLRDGERTVGVTGVGYDVTAQRRAEHERDVLRESLEEARRIESIGRLVSGIAHEINNPLAAILTFAEQLRSEARSAVDAAALEAIHAEAMRSRAIVRDLIAYVRPALPAPVTPVRLAPVLSDALRTLNPHVTSLGVELITESVDDSVWIAADVPGIEQVLTNLVINGAQSAGIGGRVSVRAVTSERSVALVIEDTGPGLSPHALAHLFDPFFTTKPIGEGTGLGLFVARGIAQRHGGTLRGENRAARDGGGARFIFEIPRTALTPNDGDPSGTAVDSTATASPARVLLVDDEESIRVSLRRYFSKKGWQVFEAVDGATALRHLRAESAESFSLILCDLRMPGMSGPELHAHVKEEFPDILDRLVMVTGDVVSTDAAAFLAQTKCRVLEKPFELRVLSALADELRGAASRSRVA